MQTMTKPKQSNSRWHNYNSPCHDELLDKNGKPKPAAAELTAWLDSLDEESLSERRNAAELAIQQMGITFTVYSDKGNIDREWPFDIIPRVIHADEWRGIERVLNNAFAP